MERFNEILDSYKLPIMLCLLGLVLIIGGIFSSGLMNKPKQYPKASLVQAKSLSGMIKVDVSGAVLKPGVYTLSSDSRIEDAIKAASGFSPLADSSFIAKSLNLSQKLSDGMKIYIPVEGETPVSAVSGISGANTSLVGLNSGSQKELESLPSVGSTTAVKIIAARPYTSISELKIKRIVSTAVFNKIKDLVDLH